MPSGGAVSIDANKRNRPYTMGELSAFVDDHETRLDSLVTKFDEIYPSAAVVAKIWGYLKYATPAMVLALLGNITPNSFLGKAITYGWSQITGG